jgi:hypothetical protein
MIHRISLAGLGVFVAVGLLCSGCGKADAPASQPTSSARATNAAVPLLKFHWVGKKQIVAANVATNFLALWNLPESARLEEQTLDKLAAAPWRLWATNVAVSNAPTAQLRPLLADLVQEEFYLEARGATNQASEFVLAIRLSSDRAALWQTNLPTVLMSMFPNLQLPASSSKPPASGSDFRFQTADFSLDFRRSGAWTLLAFGAAPERTAGLLLATNLPAFAPGSNQWIAAEVDLAQLNRSLALNWKLPPNFPRLTLSASGDESGVRTVGDLSFAAPLPSQLSPWSIPTNIIYDPLVSFTGVRGVASLLRTWLGWSEEKLGAAPDQLFFWAQSPALWQHFVTYPVAHGSNHVQTVGDYVLSEWNPIFLTNKVGNFAWATNAHRLVWRGVPFFQPVLESVPFDGRDFAVFGLFSNNATNRPVPPGLFTEFQNRSNLVYYDWELTEPQVRSWTQMGQLGRMVFGRAQLSPNTASLPWLRAVSTRFGNVTTVATLDTPQRISFKRFSTCGFTGPELHLLAEWFESPQFPVGLHTLLLPKGAGRPSPVSTNTPSN